MLRIISLNLNGIRSAVGKGFPGGEYPASRILFNDRMDDHLPQFGALVTNGQEELASLAYLITMRWAAASIAARSMTRLTAIWPAVCRAVGVMGA